MLKNLFVSLGQTLKQELKHWINGPPSMTIAHSPRFIQRPVLHKDWSIEWQHACIRELQDTLISKNYLKTASGCFDKDTELAVKAFQRDNSLKPDGIVGSITWAALLFPVLCRSDAILPDIQSKVEELQRGLREERFQVEVDGLFGPETERAVRQLQHRYKLHPDGVCNYLTWFMLLGQKVEWSPSRRWWLFPSSMLEQLLIVASVTVGIYFDPMGKEVTLSFLSSLVTAYGLSCLSYPFISSLPIDRLTNSGLPLTRYAPYVLTGFFWQHILSGFKALL